jgi:hypothetical protein
MSGLVDGILVQLGPEGMAQIANSLGTDESKTQSAIAAALPAIIAGMANNASRPEGAQELSNALGDHNPSIFDGLGGLLGGGGDGAAILGHVLGQERRTVETRQPGLGGLAAILDGDGDGSIVDDILGKLTGQ